MRFLSGPLFSENGYTGVIASGWGNPLAGRQGFVSASQGYTASRLDLGALAGKPFRLRFRIGTDDGGANYGWFIDDIHIYTCLDEPPTPTPSPVAPSATPTLSPPTATPTPMPPTATPTQRPPSATPTPIPPTATATPAPSATPHRVRLPAVLAG